MVPAGDLEGGRRQFAPEHPRHLDKDVSAWRFVPALAPWVATTNIGDLVIRDAILARLARSQIFVSEAIATHEPLDRSAAERMERVDTVLVGGSNLLSTRGRRDSQWPLPRHAIGKLAGRLVLFGVGWRVASMDPSDLPKSLWPLLLDRGALHSVRDQPSAHALERAGFDAIVTGCPSLLYVPRSIGPYDSTSIVITVTDYNPDLARDLSLFRWADSRFPAVYIQPQNEGDIEYATSALGVSRSKVLPLDLAAYTLFLRTRRPVYVGTRLHGGIRALQLGLPTVILGIDNRATDLGSEFALNVAPDPSGLDAALERACTRVSVDRDKAEQRTDEFIAALRARLDGTRTSR